MEVICNRILLKLVISGGSGSGCGSRGKSRHFRQLVVLGGSGSGNGSESGNGIETLLRDIHW